MERKCPSNVNRRKRSYEDDYEMEVTEGFFGGGGEKKPATGGDGKCDPPNKTGEQKKCPEPEKKKHCPEPEKKAKEACQQKPKKRASCPKKRPACPKKKRSRSKKRAGCRKKKPSCPKKRAACPKKREACPKKKEACPKKKEICPKPKKMKKARCPMPRSRNPFIIFFLTMYFKQPNRRVADVAREAGKEWCRMEPKDKEVYQKMACLEKKRQMRKHKRGKKHGCRRQQRQKQRKCR